MKQLIKDFAHSIYLDMNYLDGKSLDDVAAHLLLKKEELLKLGYVDVEMHIDFGYDGDSVTLVGVRMETDDEYQKRLKQEKIKQEKEIKKREKRKQKELEQLKRLKDKYKNELV